MCATRNDRARPGGTNCRRAAPEATPARRRDSRWSAAGRSWPGHLKICIWWRPDCRTRKRLCRWRSCGHLLLRRRRFPTGRVTTAVVRSGRCCLGAMTCCWWRRGRRECTWCGQRKMASGGSPCIRPADSRGTWRRTAHRFGWRNRLAVSPAGNGAPMERCTGRAPTKCQVGPSIRSCSLTTAGWRFWPWAGTRCRWCVWRQTGARAAARGHAAERAFLPRADRPDRGRRADGYRAVAFDRARGIPGGKRGGAGDGPEVSARDGHGVRRGTVA